MFFVCDEEKMGFMLYMLLVLFGKISIDTTTDIAKTVSSKMDWYPELILSGVFNGRLQGDYMTPNSNLCFISSKVLGDEY